MAKSPISLTVAAQQPAVVIDPVAVGQIVSIQLDLIDADDRLREVNEAYAEVMAASFEQRGQRQPVEVVRRGDRFRLVFGAHRLRAAQIAGWENISAIIVEADDAELRLREIDENLIRQELTALDRARFLLERKRLYEAMHPEKKNGANQWTAGLAMLANPSFSADIAEKTGFSERTIRRAVELATKLAPDVVAKVKHTPLANNQAALETLAKHPHSRQAHAVNLMLAETNPAKSVNEAFDRIDGRVVKAPEDRTLAKFIDAWGRMGAKDRRALLAFLAEAELPKGCSVEVAK